MTKTEQQQAAIEVLSNRQSVAEWLNEWQPTHEEFEALVARLTSVYEDFHNEKKKADIENLLQLMKAKGLDISDLTGSKTTKKKTTNSNKEVTPPKPMWFVNGKGEKEQIMIASRGPTDGPLKEFLAYAKSLGLARKDIVDMSESEWDAKFTAYMNKMKK